MPKSPPPAPRFLSKVPRRGAGNLWKFHQTLGHAKVALNNGHYSWPEEAKEIYEWRELAEELENGNMRLTGRYGWDLLYTWKYGEPRPW